MMRSLAITVCVAGVVGCIHYTPDARGLPREQLAVIDTRELRAPDDNLIFRSRVTLDGTQYKPGRWYVGPGLHHVEFQKPFRTPARGSVDAEAGTTYEARYQGGSIHCVRFYVNGRQVSVAR